VGLGKKILVVEDDQGLRQTFLALFRRSPHACIAVPIREGIARVRRGERPDLIIADLWGNPAGCERLLSRLRLAGGKILCLSCRECPHGGRPPCAGDTILPDAVPRKDGLLATVERLLL